jgi:hypothetical protein
MVALSFVEDDGLEASWFDNKMSGGRFVVLQCATSATAVLSRLLGRMAGIALRRD